MKNLPGIVLLLAGVTSVLVTGVSRGAEQKPAKASAAWNLYVPSQIPWKPGPSSLAPGAKMAVLEGDPAKEGFVTMRLLLPDGYRVNPHGTPRWSGRRSLRAR